MWSTWSVWVTLPCARQILHRGSCCRTLWRMATPRLPLILTVFMPPHCHNCLQAFSPTRGWQIMRYIVLLALFMAGCQTAASPPTTSHISDDKAFASARAAVLATLKEPQSARFGPAFTRKSVNGNFGKVRDIVCGTVNAKNSFGGYAGASTFAYMLDTNEVMMGETSGFDQGSTWCNW